MRISHAGHAFHAASPPRPSFAANQARQCHDRGVQHARQNRWKPALAAFREAVRLAPQQPGFHYALGAALCRFDRFDEAIRAFRKEIEVSPGHGPAIAEIGTCLARTGRPQEGIPYLQQGLRLRPQMPLAQYSLGLALLAENRRSDAIAALDAALALDASYADAYRTRGLALAMDGQLERAVEDLQSAVALDSKNAGAILELGVSFGRAAREQQAGRLFETAATISPDHALSQYYYGHFLINHRRYEQGLRHIARALELSPLHAESHVGKAFGLLGQGRIDEAVAAYRRAGELKPDSAEIAGNLLFALQHKPGVTKAELLTEHRRWAALYRKGDAHDRLLFGNDPDPQRLPRLGLVSADMHRHAVAFLTLRAFEELAALGYEIVCYRTDQKRPEDDFSERFKAAAVHWRDISQLDDAAAIKQVMDDGVDILFDLAGHTAGNRLGLFERRAAPIQLGWAGYVGTVGLDTYDGLIADAVEIPPEDDIHYAEPVIRLPDCYVSYHPPMPAPEVATLPCLAAGRFTFGCFNRPAKLNEQLARVWARILDAVPNSRILMVYGGLDEASTRDAVYGMLARGGIDRDRVDLVGESEQSKLLVAYHDVDLALDPFPYSAGVTTLEAMWMGVPTVTLVGDTFAGRHAATHLTAAGLHEFCARTTDDYVALAVNWSNRRAELAATRQELRQRVAASPLCDAPRFAKNLSNELTRLWTSWIDAHLATSSATTTAPQRNTGS